MLELPWKHPVQLCFYIDDSIVILLLPCSWQQIGIAGHWQLDLSDVIGQRGLLLGQSATTHTYASPLILFLQNIKREKTHPQVVGRWTFNYLQRAYFVYAIYKVKITISHSLQLQRCSFFPSPLSALIRPKHPHTDRQSHSVCFLTGVTVSHINNMTHINMCNQSIFSLAPTQIISLSS